jgi:hypothetical protein
MRAPRSRRRKLESSTGPAKPSVLIELADLDDLGYARCVLGAAETFVLAMVHFREENRLAAHAPALLEAVVPALAAGLRGLDEVLGRLGDRHREARADWVRRGGGGGAEG